MNTKLILLSAVIVSLAVGFVLYSNPGYVEDIKVASGAQYEETVAASSDANGVPTDILYTLPVETVAFSHKTHAVDLEFKCDTCHSGIFQMKAKTVQARSDFNMKGLEAGKYCGSCHTGEKGAAFASDSQCARCHIGVTGLEAETGLEGESLDARLEAENGEVGEPAGNG